MILQTKYGWQAKLRGHAAMLVPLLLLGACNTASLEEAATGVRNTDTFPNLNIAPQAATAQFSPQERAQGVAQMQALRARQQAQGAATGGNSAASLQRLKQSHADDALRQIESQAAAEAEAGEGTQAQD